MFNISFSFEYHVDSRISDIEICCALILFFLNSPNIFLSFFLSFFLFSSQPADMTADLIICLLSFLFSFHVVSYKSHDSFFLSFFLSFFFTSNFSFFKDYNKKMLEISPSFLSFFLLFLSSLNSMYTDTQMYTQNATLVFYIIWRSFSKNDKG